MSIDRSLLTRSQIILIACVVFLAGPIYGQSAVWRNVTQAEIDMKTPQVEADADAEAIFWEIRMDDRKSNKLMFDHYVRVKIFTDRGRERFSKMDIPFMKGRKIENVAARVIRPDGSIIELKPGDIFEREIVKAGKQVIQAKSFAVPGIDKGVIVEYQYSESVKNDSLAGERLVFQRDIPMQKVVYYIRPLKDYSLNFHAYNMEETHFADSGDGFKVGSMSNVPAYKDEPFMPPDDEVRRWMYLSYSTFGRLFQWSNLSNQWAYLLQKLAKPNKEVKAKAAELTAGAATDEDKVRRIYEFIQRRIKNVDYDPGLSEEQIDKMDIKDADDALRRGMGRSEHLDLLFAALVKASGLEPRIFLAGDRSDNFFTPEKYPFINFVRWSGIAVWMGDKWRFFDPCGPFMPYGTIRWNHEAVSGMLVGEGGYTWKTPPYTEPERSIAKRIGKFKLSEDGTLDGEVEFQYDGQQALSKRIAQFRDSPQRREERIEDEIKSKLPTAEFSSFFYANFDDNSKPLSYKLKVHVPNYAQRAGKRLIFQPGFFEYGSQPVFSSTDRTYSVYFPFPWSEQDIIEIKLPDGFEIDNAESPGDVADTAKICELKIKIAIDRENNILFYNRNFFFGKNGKINFPVETYRAVKTLFDAFQKAETHSILLKQN